MRRAIYTVETRKTKADRWTIRRYFFTNLREAQRDVRVCTGPLGYYAAKLRVWRR